MTSTPRFYKFLRALVGGLSRHDFDRNWTNFFTGLLGCDAQIRAPPRPKIYNLFNRTANQQRRSTTSLPSASPYQNPRLLPYPLERTISGPAIVNTDKIRSFKP
jgi:hypothetical protein